jgi:DNA-binding NtrC family response regulator
LAGALVRVPALRERLDDLPLLVPRLLSDLGRSDLRVADSTLQALKAHAWPGNVRELKNVLAYAMAFVDGSVLEARHLRFLGTAQNACPLEHLPLGGQTLEQIERAAIKQTLVQTSGNKVHAARTLGIAVSTLYEKLKKYQIS